MSSVSSQHVSVRLTLSLSELQPLLDPLIDSIIDSESPTTILEIGCGMKPILTCLNFDLDSTLNLISLDYSPPCITYLQSSFKSKKSKKYTFEVADAKNLKYEDNSIPIVIEKGTLDAIITSGVSNAVKVLSEMSRVTSRYLLVVTHFNLETEEGQEWMEDVLEPSLNVEDDGVFWKVNCNVGEGGGAMVIICEKCVRRETRNKGGERMQIEVTEY